MEELGLELDTGYTPGALGPKETQVHITVGDARMREADVPDLEKEARIRAREESAKKFWEAENAKQQDLKLKRLEKKMKAKQLARAEKEKRAREAEAMQEAGIDLDASDDDDAGPAAKKTKTGEEEDDEEASAVVRPKEKKSGVLRKKKRFGGI